ncbi:hypothetical protein [Methanosarcina sp.]|uniref:hypothetical protein n=1 Tax=Methanosarcina sp. TaxID=2213 RepID=UPI0029882ED3|nr:hypothetical protein [Methanosarcina sp.]MDW5550465.1 hypothetical protein [Methanosarcina sp.]MDW5554871.1 hypothetical protein [Methanosarcina sp.]MDW5559912.1 hypothetical protein [Methanosarcina sp.]
MGQARDKALDKRTNAFKTLAGIKLNNLAAVIKRPKQEEILVSDPVLRYEPFWYISCKMHYKYDRTRSYNVSDLAPEVQSVTIDGNDYTVTTKQRQFTIKGIEHCIEDASTIDTFNAINRQKQDFKKYVQFDKESISDFSQLSNDGGLIVEPEMCESAVVNAVVESLRRLFHADTADTILEEKVDFESVDLYFRPIYIFEYTWETRGNKSMAEIDGLTGDVNFECVTLRKKVEKLMNRDLLFDISADAANLLIPGSGIPVRVFKELKKI